MELIKNTIQIVFKELTEKNSPAQADGLGEILKKVLAKKALQHVKLYTFRKGILNIKADSSTGVYFLNLQKEDLLRKLQRYNCGVKEIRFSLGE